MSTIATSAAPENRSAAGPFLDLDGAIARSTLSRSAILRAVRSGRLRVCRPPGTRRLIFDVEDLDAFVRGERSTQTTTATKRRTS